MSSLKVIIGLYSYSDSYHRYLTIFQVEINRKREFEITKMRKDLEGAQLALEMESETLRKRHNATVAELTDQIELLTRQRNK